MKQLYMSELETDIRIYLGATKKGLVYKDWREINGIIIPGKPGSGKSNTAVWLANQLAANGVKLVRMEYEADENNAQTFINQTSHLTYADYMPYAIEQKDIENTIAAIYTLGMKRKTVGTFENKNQFPIAVMIDEITSLLSQPFDKIEIITKTDIENGKEKRTSTKRTMMDNLNDMVRMFRKANIKFIVMGQNWQASGNASKISAFRRNFNTVLYHKINAKDVELFDMATPDVRRIIQKLNAGQMFYNGVTMFTPHMVKYPIINTKAAQLSQQYMHLDYKNNAPLVTHETIKLTIEDKPMKYKKIDGRWTW